MLPPQQGGISPQASAYEQRLLQEQFHQFQQQQPQQPCPQVVLVGESFGGALALRVALAAPHLLRGVVLVNPGEGQMISLGHGAGELVLGVDHCTLA